MSPVLFLIFTFLCSRGGLDFPLAAGISTIGSGEELNSSSPLVSDGGNFTLGFFTIPETNYTYLGICLWMWELTPKGRIDDEANTRSYGSKDNVFCYGYESVFTGCVTSELPRCRSNNDKFEEKRVYFTNTMATSEYEENTSLSLSDCMERCWNVCNCVAFTVPYSNETGCQTWRGKLEYQDDNPDVPKIYVLVRGSSSKGDCQSTPPVEDDGNIVLRIHDSYLKFRKNVDMDSHCSGNFSSYAHCGHLLLSKNQKAKIRRRREEEAKRVLTRVDTY
ncbi:hypothetical protein C3L33_08844, partial [Rhododendron williamsianum]